MDFFCVWFFYPDWRGLELWSNCLLSFFQQPFILLKLSLFCHVILQNSGCPELNFIKLSSASFKHYAALWLACVYWLTSTAHIIIISLFCCYATYDTYFGWITFRISTHNHTVGWITGDAVLKPVNCIVKWGNRVVNIAVLFSFVKSVLHELFKRSSAQHRTNQKPLSHEAFA